MRNTSARRFATLRIIRQRRNWCLIRRIGGGAARDFVTSLACYGCHGARLCEPLQRPHFQDGSILNANASWLAKLLRVGDLHSGASTSGRLPDRKSVV